MYIKKQHRLTDIDAMFSLIEEHALGAWVVAGAPGLDANHLPFLLDRTQGPCGTLVGHVARANPVWRTLGTAASSLVIFQGPHSYITPSWYPGKAEDGKVVPTWDYAVVHAYGTARPIDDPGRLLEVLDGLTNAHEAAQPVPWKIGDAPASYIDKLLRAIVGIEIPIERLEGKLKASQDEAAQDRRGTVEGLRGLAHAHAAAMAELVMQALERDGKQ